MKNEYIVLLYRMPKRHDYKKDYVEYKKRKDNVIKAISAAEEEQKIHDAYDRSSNSGDTVTSYGSFGPIRPTFNGWLNDTTASYGGWFDTR